MIPLIVIKAAGLPVPDPIDLESIIAQEEQNWAELGKPTGVWFDHPACLEPIDEGSKISRET